MDVELGKHRRKWVAQWIDGGKRKRRSSGLDATRENRAKASVWVQEVGRAINQPAVLTCGYIFSEYLIHIAEKPAHQTASANWKSLVRVFEHLAPESVTEAVCRQYRDMRREEGRANSTIRTELGYLKTALVWQNRNTPARFELPAASEPREIWLDRSEVQKLVSVSDGHIKLFIHLAIATGGRREALLDLRWGRNIDWDHGFIDLGVKENGKRRAVVPMNQTVRQALTEAQDANVSGFVIEYGGKRIRDVKKGLQSAARRAGIDKPVGAHMFRHSAAIWMAKEDIPLQRISQYLGHSSIRVTEKHYARYKPDFLHDAAAALELYD